MQKPQLFYLERDEDETGVSGTGRVATGVILPSGRAVFEWVEPGTSIALHESIESVERIHGHEGKTRIVLES